MLHHNKKRNVGLINEFFARHIAKKIIDKDFEAVKKAKGLYKKHFCEGSELAKENYLYGVLYTTNVSNKEIANSLLEKVKIHSKKQNQESLDKEKTKLIHEINMGLQDKEFFEQSVSDFRDQATIQVLLNSWRDNKINENYNLADIAKLEDNLLERLTNIKKETINENVLEMTNQDIDSLVVSIMMEKFNEKYADLLTEEQRKIISSYVLSDYDNSKKQLIECLESLRNKTLALIESVNSKNKIGKEVLTEGFSKKIIGVKNLLMSQYKDTSKLDENTISFYMQLTEMEKELREEDK